jgi:hypothetical protein
MLLTEVALRATRGVFHLARTAAPEMTEQASLTAILEFAGEHGAHLSLLALSRQRASLEQILSIPGFVGLAGESILALKVRHAPAVHAVAILGHHAEEAAEPWIAVRVRAALPAIGEHVLPLHVGEHGNHIGLLGAWLAQVRARQGGQEQPHERHGQ